MNDEFTKTFKKIEDIYCPHCGNEYLDIDLFQKTSFRLQAIVMFKQDGKQKYDFEYGDSSGAEEIKKPVISCYKCLKTWTFSQFVKDFKKKK